LENPVISKTRFALVVLGLVLLAAGFIAAAAASRLPSSPTLDGFERFVRADGSLHYSPSAAEGLVHLGSWFVPEGDAAGFHHVFTQPEAIAIHRATGVFPDGTAIVKEIVSARRASYTTGANVASATTTKQWFLMVKDASGRFGEDPLWGQGWGWALFLADEPTKNAATDYRGDCLGCHAPAQASDWVYTEGYPALRNR